MDQEQAAGVDWVDLQLVQRWLRSLVLSTRLGDHPATRSVAQEAAATMRRLGLEDLIGANPEDVFALGYPDDATMAELEAEDARTRAALGLSAPEVPCTRKFQVLKRIERRA